MSAILLVVCLACSAMGAPQADLGAVGPVDPEGRSSNMPLEHRQDKDGHPVEIFVNKVLSSDTASALDSAAANFASLFGDIVEDIGDFVISTVDDLPETIDRISQRAGEAVANGGEKVVIIVRGVRTRVNSAKDETAEVAQNTVSKVGDALETSEILPSIFSLGERLGSTIERIADSIASNFGHIDKAVAGGIRRVSGTTSDLYANGKQPAQQIVLDEKEPNVSENELRNF